MGFMTYVQLFKSSTGWNIRYQEGPRADLIRKLFGTDTLPLPYAAEMSLPAALAKFVCNTHGVILADPDGRVVLA